MLCTYYNTIEVPQSLYETPISISHGNQQMMSAKTTGVRTTSAYTPPPRLPTEMPPPINPTLAIIKPTSQTQHTHILERPFRQLIIPPILDLLDLLALGEDFHFTVNGMLGSEPLDLVHGLEVDLDGVAGASN
jgi:hypothetical protein